MKNHDRYIDEHSKELIELLTDLIKIPSVRSDAKQNKPFGPEVDRCYRCMLKTAEADGFETVDIDAYGGHIEWRGGVTDSSGEIIAAAEETIGIPIHLDVVPEGEGWSHPPYAAEIENGRMYGRGTSDDKGPAAAAYFAAKALKATGYVPQKNVRFIIGLDEETGWGGMEKYFEKVDPPDLGFVPDGEFPVINGEKGILDFQIAKKLEKVSENGIVIRSIEGGNASNMVPDNARAIIMNSEDSGFDEVKGKIAEYREKTGYRIYGKGVGKAFEISVKGISAHGSRPELGQNAISILMDFLGGLSLASESVAEFVDTYNKYIGFDLGGESLGIGFEDALSGHLVLNAGLIEMDKEAVIVTFNVRCPVTCKEEQVYDNILPLIHDLDLGLVKLGYKPPIFFPKDHPFIATLVDVYREVTGDVESQPLVIGGGTYARAIPNAVAFGAMFPWNEDCMHQKDEYIVLDDLMKATHIYANAIYRLTGGE
jgi:succinyl-diaminopimelate desuccinylase